MKKLIGFYGCPPREMLNKYRDEYGLPFFDLDEDVGSPETKTLPEAYCRIIKNIIDNAVAMKDSLDIIIAAVGEDKCDQGRFAALLLKDMGFNVLEVRNNDINIPQKPIIISSSNLSLVQKIERIMKTVCQDDTQEYNQCQATHGFWGVPPHDFKILEVFPNTTHVFGWTRCVEAGVPAHLDLECYVNPKIPTVFFTQTFCGKQMLAKRLADKYRGLFVDCDGPATPSVLAKIEAFIRLG